MNPLAWIQDAPPLDIIYVESAFSAAIFLVLLVSPLLGLRASRRGALLMMFLWLIVISQRPESYNTDTQNYSAYYLGIGSIGVLEMFLLKLEPLHFLLAIVSSSFHNWLLLESLLVFAMLVQLLRDKSLITIAVVLGAISPLMSSSFRFCVGLLLALLAYDFCLRRNSRYWIVGPVGVIGHISMGAAPFLVRLSAANLFLPLIFVAAIWAFPELGDRVLGDGHIGALNGVVGVKTLGVFVVLYLFYLLTASSRPVKQTGWMHQYLLLMIMLFVAANVVFEMANRWMVFVLLLFSLRASAVQLKLRPPMLANALAASLVFSMLSFPQWILLIANGGWYDAVN